MKTIRLFLVTKTFSFKLRVASLKTAQYTWIEAWARLPMQSPGMFPHSQSSLYFYFSLFFHCFMPCQLWEALISRPSALFFFSYVIHLSSLFTLFSLSLFYSYLFSFFLLSRSLLKPFLFLWLFSRFVRLQTSWKSLVSLESSSLYSCRSNFVF